MDRKTTLVFIFLGVIWGTNFLFMHMASRYITPMQIVFLRVLFGFIPLLIAACWLKVLRREHLRYLHHLVGAASVTYVPPVVALLVGYLFGGEVIGVTEITAMLCIFGGVFFLQKRQ